MLAEQLTEVAAVARNSAALDNLARLLWRAHREGHMADADAEAVSEAVQARRATFGGQGPTPRPAVGLPRRANRPERREKMFGPGRPAPSIATPRSGSCTGRAAFPAGRRRARLTARSPRRRWPCSSRFSGTSTTPGAASASRPTSGSPRGRLRPLDRRGGHQGPRGRGDPLIGAKGQAGARAMPRSAGRQRLALARAEDVQRPTPITSATPERTILPSPNRLEHRFKVFLQ